MAELMEERFEQALEDMKIAFEDGFQFKDISTQVVVAPAEYESGKVIYPYEKAK